MQKRYSTCFSFNVTVKTVIEANSIRELRAKIRDELREPDSYLTLPSSLVSDPERLKIQRKPQHKYHYPSDDDLMIEIEHENSLLVNTLVTPMNFYNLKEKRIIENLMKVSQS